MVKKHIIDCSEFLWARLITYRKRNKMSTRDAVNWLLEVGLEKEENNDVRKAETETGTKASDQ